VELREPAAGDSATIALRPGGAESNWLYVVRGRYGREWSTEIVPGYYAVYAVPRTRSGASLDRVVVQAVDRLGQLSAARALRVPSGGAVGDAPGER
jgi:hypothetical protein